MFLYSYLAILFVNTVLYHNPGQQVTLTLETLDADGVRKDGYVNDGYFVPFVSRILFPTLQAATGYPQNMVKIDTGLYYYKFQLPVNATSVGTYLADITYYDPGDSLLKKKLIQIVVTAPFGNYNITAV